MLKTTPVLTSLALVAATSSAFGQLTLTLSDTDQVGGTLGPPDAADIAVFDLNHDGFMDIISYNVDGILAPPMQADFLAIMLGNGDGTFQPVANSIATGLTLLMPAEHRSRMMVGEFTGDSNPDIVITHHGTHEVALIPNDGVGGFGTPTQFDTGAPVASLHVDDYNEDGLDDVLAVSLAGYNLTFFAGTGSGLAAGVGMLSGSLSAHQPWDFDVADMDNDGHLDVVIPYQLDETNTAVNKAIGYRGAGDGTFDMLNPFLVDVGPILANSRTFVQCDDLDRDGFLDVVAVRDNHTGGTADHLFAAYGNGAGYGAAQAYSVSGQENLSEFTLADMDFDGNLDIVTICNGPFVMEVLLGDGMRGFTAQGNIDPMGPAGMYSVHAADVTGDAKLDVVLGFQFTGHVLVYRNDTLGTPGPGTAYCFGDAACPCGNLGSSNTGCLTSSASGGQLAGSGVASVFNDTVVLEVAGAPASVPGVYFSGINATGGALFGDGKLCVSGPIKRLGVVFTDGSGQAQTPFSVSGTEGLSAGDLRHYQYWFRDVPGPCGSGFNTTNAYSIQW